MAAKVILTICASALFIQSAVGQCWNRATVAGAAPKAWEGYNGCGYGELRAPLSYDSCGYGAAADIAAARSLNAACGGSLQVSSSSATAPTGLNVASDNVYEGQVAVGGNLPFLGTVALEGSFPSVGAGGISYGCGDGAIGIVAENFAPSSGVAPAAAVAREVAVAPAAGIAAPLGLGYKGYAGRVGSCGCNNIY